MTAYTYLQAPNFESRIEFHRQYNQTSGKWEVTVWLNGHQQEVREFATEQEVEKFLAEIHDQS